MISSLHLNKQILLVSIFFFTFGIFGLLSAEEEALDIWKKKLTEKQIEEDYVVLSGVKPRSKYIQIWVDEEIGDYSSENPFCQDHLHSSLQGDNND